MPKYNIAVYEDGDRIKLGYTWADTAEGARLQAAIDFKRHPEVLEVVEVKARVEVKCKRCGGTYRGKRPVVVDFAICPLCTAKQRVLNRRHDYMNALAALEKMEKKQRRRP